MEHPGDLRNSIKTSFNRLAGRILPAAALRWGWVLVHAGLLCGAGLFLAITTGVTAFFVTDSIWSALSEPVYAATPEIVNPAHEGKLVKISGVITSDSMVCDPLTGVQAKGPFLTRTTTLNPEQEYKGLLVEKRWEIARKLITRGMPELPGHIITPVNTHVTLTGQGKLGAFRIPRFGTRELNCCHFTDRKTTQELTFTQAAPGLKARPLAPDSPHVILSTEDGEDICCLQYYTGTTTLYLVARQFGNELDLNDPDASIIDYESERWRERTRARHFMMHPGELSGTLFIALTAHFILAAVALSSLRSGVRHATAGRVNLLRLPLLPISLLLGVFLLLLVCGIFLAAVACLDHISLQPGLIALMAAAAILCYTVRRWLLQKN